VHVPALHVPTSHGLPLLQPPEHVPPTSEPNPSWYVTVAPEYAPSGTASGSALSLTGVTVQINAPVSGPDIYLAVLWPNYSIPLSTTQENAVTVMPLLQNWQNYAFYLGNDTLATFTFNVDEAGNIVYDPKYTYASGAGTPELTLTPAQVTLDVSSSTVGTFFVGGLGPTGYFPRPSSQTLSLLPDSPG